MSGTTPTGGSATTPTHFNVKDQGRRLMVTWNDGRVSQFDATQLRKHCPCATCNANRRERTESSDLFPILKSDPGTGPMRLVGAQLVGNYAIQFTWSDGHSTGIFDFKFLRSLDTAP